jgi:hypothetical protein
MYSGKQPTYIISVLVGLLVIVGALLLSFLDAPSGLTSRAVQDIVVEEAVVEPIPLGSASRALDLSEYQVIDEETNIPFDAGRYAVTVTHAKTMKRIGTYVGPENFHGVDADKLFYVVQMNIVLKEGVEGYVPVWMFTLSDGTTEYALDQEAAGYLFETSILSLVMRVGMKKIVKVPFDVDEGSYDLLVYGEEHRVYRVPLKIIKTYDIEIEKT